MTEETNNESEQNNDNKNGSNTFTILLSIGISLVAIILLIFHLFKPAFKIDTIGFSLLVLAMLPLLLPLLGSYLKSGKILGQEFEFLQDKIKAQGKEISKQWDNMDFLTLVLAGIISKYEERHLKGLADTGNPYIVTLNRDLKDELMRLLAFGFINLKEGMGLNALDEKYGADINKYLKEDKTEFDLKEYMYISDFGKKYIELSKVRGLPERP